MHEGPTNVVDIADLKLATALQRRHLMDIQALLDLLDKEKKSPPPPAPRMLTLTLLTLTSDVRGHTVHPAYREHESVLWQVCMLCICMAMG